MLSEAGLQPEPEYDAFEALCDAAFPDDEDGVMLFWKSYMDGSGRHSDLLVVAGYLSARPNWKAFNQAWRPLLTTDGQFAPFHAADFESGHGDFTVEKGWSEERRNEVRIQLIDGLLGANLHKGFACCVRISDYDETTPRHMREQLGLGSAYEFAVHACMGVAARWAQDNDINEPIQYVVEHGEGKEGKFQEAFNNAFAIPAARQFFRLGKLIFDTKQGAIGLQAADMLANYMWAWQSGSRPSVEPFTRITHAPNLRWELFDRENLQKQIEIDRKGRTTVTPEGTLYRKTPEPIDVVVNADFSDAEAMLTELESLADTCPERVYSLIKHSPSLEKLFSVNAENVSAPEANELRVSFKPNDFALSTVAAIGTSQPDGNLGEGEISHQE